MWERRKYEVMKYRESLKEVKGRENSEIEYRKEKRQGDRYERKNEGIKETKLKEVKNKKGMKEEKRGKEERNKTG